MREEIEHFLNVDSSTNVKMFFIYKSAHRSVSKKFHAHVAEIDDEFKPDFDSIAETALIKAKDNYRKIKKFTDPENTDEYRTIKKTALPELEGLLEEIDKQSDLSPVVDTREMKKTNNVYCFQLKTSEKRIFVFAKIDGHFEYENKEKIVAEFKNKKLKKLEEEMIIFDKNVFTIYFKESETLLMIDYNSTKALLDFKNQFKNKCAKILTDELQDTFVCNPDKLDAILNNSRTNELFLKMYDSDKIDKNKSHYKKWNKFYDKHPLDVVTKLNLNESDSPLIDSSKELAMTLYVSNNDIMEGIVKPGEYALVFSKTILRKK